MIALTPHPLGTVVSLKARPGAKKDAILGERLGALRVSVTAPPDKGRANEAIVDVLAAGLDLKRSSIRLLSGETSRDKRLLVESITPEELRARLDRLLDASPTRRSMS